jgi:hypothetical protein
LNEASGWNEKQSRVFFMKEWMSIKVPKTVYLCIFTTIETLKLFVIQWYRFIVRPSACWRFRLYTSSQNITFCYISCLFLFQFLLCVKY